MTLRRTPLKAVSAKPRKCKVRTCRAPFVPSKSFQTWCSPECGVQIAQAAQAKERKSIEQRERKELQARKEKLKSRSEHAKEAQAEFNRWVRLRDADLPCISCGRYHQGKYDAGHYRSVGSNPALRFEPLNCHRQCVPCNQHKSGNAIEYRIGLVARIGAEAVAWLEGRHEPKHYSIDDLKQIKARYLALVRDIKKGEATHATQ